MILRMRDERLTDKIKIIRFLRKSTLNYCSMNLVNHQSRIRYLLFIILRFLISNIADSFFIIADPLTNTFRSRFATVQNEIYLRLS